MPKIRGIKPEFWTDEDVVELSIPARLLFIGMWNFACDNGHLPDKPRQLKMKLFPSDDVNVEALLGELTEFRRITRADGVITIRKFALHQKPHTRWWLTCEVNGCAPPEGATTRPINGGAKVSNAPSQPEPHHDSTVAQPLQDGRSPDDGDVELDGDGDGDTSRHESADAAPRKIEEQERRDDVEELCSLLAALITENGSKATITKGWRDAARLMLDRDQRDLGQALDLIEWSQQDSFWRTNVLSMPKFREKYDQLRMKSGIGSAPKAGSNGHTNPALDPDGYLPGRRRGEADPPILPPPSDMPGQFFRDWNLTNSDRWRRGQNPLTDWRELEQVGA